MVPRHTCAHVVLTISRLRCASMLGYFLLSDDVHGAIARAPLRGAERLRDLTMSL